MNGIFIMWTIMYVVVLSILCNKLIIASHNPVISKLALAMHSNKVALTIYAHIQGNFTHFRLTAHIYIILRS